ncbi:MAG: glucosaminidase domain-containing protein, partial [Bacteroidota bacterium]|nr:glucosaminidase domain-containing protein [Bacteroidota bacterium]
MVKQLSIFFFLFSFLSVFSQNKTETYIEKYSSIAIDEMNRYNIPASITLAQGILESGNGESILATEGNNHFGIKCHENWNGETIIEDDDEKGECFRKYIKVADSYRDHSLFLTERERYTSLFLLSPTNYKAWAKGLKKAGYATNPKYPSLLIDLIEKYDLSRFDKSSAQQKNFYFAHSYGLPYLSGIGAYYFKKKSIYFIGVNTAYAFSDAIIGYYYELLDNFYTGANAGIIYLPTKEETIITQIAVELMYKKSSKKQQYNSVLIR